MLLKISCDIVAPALRNPHQSTPNKLSSYIVAAHSHWLFAITTKYSEPTGGNVALANNGFNYPSTCTASDPEAVIGSSLRGWKFLSVRVCASVCSATDEAQLSATDCVVLMADDAHLCNGERETSIRVQQQPSYLCSFLRR